MPETRRGQGAFEYVLLLGGVIMVVILTVTILRGGILGSANASIGSGMEAYQSVAALPPAGGITFLAHFNGDLFGSEGESPNVSVESNLTFQQARFGLGLKVDGPDQLYYATAGNFNINQGTIAFWVLPDSTWSNVGWARYLFISSRSQGVYDQLSVGKSSGASERINFMVMGTTNYSVSAPGPSTSNWSNQLHHIAATWKGINSGQADVEMHLSVDGEEVATPVTGGQTNVSQRNRFYIGSGIGAVDGNGNRDWISNSTIDEFVIYDRPLSPVEVASLAHTTLEVLQ